MPVSIGMDTILFPVQNRDLQSINYGRLRKPFHKATCNPSWTVLITHSKYGQFSCLHFNSLYRESSSFQKHEGEVMNRHLGMKKRAGCCNSTHHESTPERKEVSGTLCGTQEPEVQLLALKQHFHSSTKITLSFCILTLLSPLKGVL